MTRSIIQATASLALAATALAGVGGTAHAQTREHVLLARQVGVPAVAQGHAGADAELAITARIDRLPRS